jgi:hypothetical protein
MRIPEGKGMVREDDQDDMCPKDDRVTDEGNTMLKLGSFERTVGLSGKRIQQVLPASAIRRFRSKVWQGINVAEGKESELRTSEGIFRIFRIENLGHGVSGGIFMKYIVYKERFKVCGGIIKN